MNPNISAIINAVVAAIGGLAAMSPSVFPAFISPGTATQITQTAGFVFALWGGINSALHVTSSSKPGALGK